MLGYAKKENRRKEKENYATENVTFDLAIIVIITFVATTIMTMIIIITIIAITIMTMIIIRIENMKPVTASHRH